MPRCSWLGRPAGGRGSVSVAPTLLACPGHRLRVVPACTRTQSQLTLHNDALAGIEAGGDCRAVALGASELDLAQLNAVIRMGHEHVGSTLPALNGHGGQADRVRSDGEVDLDI